MSTCSNLSNISVGLNGEVVNLEKALDETVRFLQTHLNSIQNKLRQIAMSSEQTTGGEDFEDLKQSVKECEELEDEISEMNELFTDLRDIASQLAYLPETKPEREWLKQHKIERKAQVQAKKKENEDRRKKDKEVYKAMSGEECKSR